MNTKTLTPAQQAKEALRQAEERALAQEWKEYREAQERHRIARFPELGWNHGTIHTYKYYKCRCQECTQAMREYQRARNKKIREANPPKPRPAPRGRGRVITDDMHGTTTGYSYGCRCNRCRDAKRVWKNNRKMLTHGTEYLYKKGCRCKKCTQAANRARRAREKKASPAPIPSVLHGTENGYTHYKCRCQECTRAHREVAAAKTRALREHYKNNPHLIPESKHGTENGYVSYSCRCQECTRAHRVYVARARARKREREND